jgi:transposase InsO family protein
MTMKLASTYPIRLICQVLDYPRSSYYYQPGESDDAQIETAIEQVAERWPKYGYRRITVQLRREKQLAVNSKRVRRLMRKKGLQAQIQRKKRRTTNSEHAFPRYPNLVQALEVVRPDQVWVADITYIRLLTEFVYLAVIMDVFTRCIRGWYLGRSLDQDLTLMALKRGLVAHAPEVHHSDQGVQYAATAYVDVLKAHQIAISMAEVGEAWQNGYAERLVRTIKEEEVDLSDYRDYADAYGQIGRFLDDVYMHKRIHSALGYLTPVEFESQWLAQQTAVAVVAAEVVQL